MFVSSLKPDAQIFADVDSPRAFLPVGDISLANYAGMFDRVPVGRFLLNSIFVTTAIVVLGLIINSMAGFALSRMEWTGRKFVLVAVIATLIVPFETIAVPMVYWVSKLPTIVFEGGIPLYDFGWLNSYKVQIMPFVANAFSIFLFTQYFSTIPKSLDEAARVDGAGWFTIYRSIIAPLAGPAYATVAILTFLPAWNAYLWPLMVVQREELRPVMVGTQYFFQLNPAWGELMAYTSLITLPVLIVFSRSSGRSSAASPPAASRDRGLAVMDSTAALPTLHIRPTRGWLSDPNGMTKYAGRWHVFYQHNPLQARHGAIQWGHVSSADLVTWTEHPVAFGPKPHGPDSGGCWSGSFFPWGDRPAVTYTGIMDSPERSSVCVRYAGDESLETWSEPVIVARQPEGAGIRVMRDPYPFEWDGRRFALLGAGMADGTPSVLLFSCDDPHSWRFEGLWLTGHDDLAAELAPADIWECPQLLRLGDSYVLVLSLQTQGRLEDVVYLIGSVVETATMSRLPQFVAQAGDKLDHGPDFYAPQVINDGSESPLLFGWVRQEDAPRDAPDDAVAGCLTLPRRLRLEGRRIHVMPDSALEALMTGGAPVQVDPEDRVKVEEAEPVSLPSRAKVTIRATGSPSARVELSGGGAPIPVDVDGSFCDIWLDGEIVEIYRVGTIAATIRRPGTASWSISGELDRCVLTIQELALPRRTMPTGRYEVAEGTTRDS